MPGLENSDGNLLEKAKLLTAKEVDLLQVIYARLLENDLGSRCRRPEFQTASGVDAYESRITRGWQGNLVEESEAGCRMRRLFACLDAETEAPLRVYS